MNNKQKILLLSACVFVIILIVIRIVFSLMQTSTPTQTPLITPTGIPFSGENETNGQTSQQSSLSSDMEKTIIGKTTERAVQILPDTLATTSSIPDATMYVTKPDGDDVTDEILVQHGVVIFEKTRTLVAGQTPPSLATYEQMLGKPENVIASDETPSTYFFTSKGYVLVANPNTDEIYEVQRFTPMSEDNYKSLFGDFLPAVQDEGP
ncbi:MAG: hypothetical protein ACREGI_04730 [Candidatus Levyibacteriota bacterium]